MIRPTKQQCESSGADTFRVGTSARSGCGAFAAGRRTAVAHAAARLCSSKRGAPLWSVARWPVSGHFSAQAETCRHACFLAVPRCGSTQGKGFFNGSGAGIKQCATCNMQVQLNAATHVAKARVTIYPRNCKLCQVVLLMLLHSNLQVLATTSTSNEGLCRRGTEDAPAGKCCCHIRQATSLGWSRRVAGSKPAARALAAAASAARETGENAAGDRRPSASRKLCLHR